MDAIHQDFWLDIEREIEEELEACRNCAYNDCGSCSCYEKKKKNLSAARMQMMKKVNK